MPFDVAGARKAGYSDSEIADFLAPTSDFDVAGARKSGYDDKEIVGFLSTQPERKPSWKDAAKYDVRGLISGVDNALGAGLGMAAGIYNNLFGLSDDELAVLQNSKTDPLSKEQADRVRKYNPGNYLESGSRALNAEGNRIDSENLSRGEKAYASKEYLTTDASKSAFLSPTKVIHDVFNSLPSTAILALSARFGGTAANAARAEALAAGATEAVANKAAVDAAVKVVTRAGAAGEGALGYEQQYAQTRDQVMSLPEDKLAASPEYQDFLKQGYDAETARKLLASRAGNMAGFVAGIVDAGTNLASGRILGKVIGEGGKLLARTGKAAASEAIQEGVQSAGEQLGSNYAVRETADPTQSLTEGVAEATVQGAAIGGLTGGAVGVVSGEHGLMNNAPDESTSPLPPPGTPPVAAPVTPAPVTSSVIPATPEATAIEKGAAAPVPVAAETAPVAAPAAATQAAPPVSTVTPGQKASVDKVLAAPDVDAAIRAAAETAVSSAIGTPRASLDKMIDDTRKVFDEQLPNRQLEKVAQLFGGLNSGTVVKAEDGMLEYHTAQGAKFPLQIWTPDPKNPDAAGISPELADAQVKHYKDLGVDVVYIRDDKAIPFDGVVDPTQPNTIFLSSNPTRNAAQVAQHEVTHVFENTQLPDGTSLADLMHQQIAEGVTNEGLEHAALLHGDTAPSRESFPNTPEGQAAHADAVMAHLFNELGADIGGEAPKFQGFVQKVMDAVETRYGGGVASQVFHKFMENIKHAITTLRTFFTGGETQSQKWVTNLEKVHDTLAQMYAAKYGEAAKLPEAPVITPEEVIKMADEIKPPPTRAGPVPREGYETAKKQAEVYKRWLGELDEKRRADAEKSSEVAALRKEEATIVGKVRDERYLTKTARTRLARVRADLETRLNPKDDSEDMALVRKKMVEAQGRMADAASVSKKDGAKPKAKEFVGESQKVGKPAPRPSETGNPAEEDRFVANQIAQDTGSALRFSPKVKEEPQPVFFSALERGVDAVKFDKAPPGQWLATIRNMPGIKAEEIKTTGIEKWLNAQTRPVTKTEVLEQIQIGEVKIEEVQKGAPTEEYMAASRAYREAIKRDAPEEEIKRLYDARIALYAGDPKFASYRLPGGQNYRELLMTLPEGKRDMTGWTAVEGPGDPASGPVWEVRNAQGRWIVGVPRANFASAEEVIRYASRDDRAGPIPGNYSSSHWAEPNVLAHTRFDERTGPNGERILHVAEIQSDWHQTGRREGYAAPEAEIQRLQKEAKAAGDELFALREKKMWEATDGKYTSKTEALDAGDKDAFNKIRAINDDPEVIAASEKHDVATEAFRRARSNVPDAPFKNTWHELVFKRLLRYAVDNGFDRISWDTGETNAERYDLSKTMSKITYNPRTERLVVYGMEGWEPEGHDGDNNGEEILNQKAKLEDLPGIIGKEAADKIVAQKSEDYRVLTGEGLKVGGEGMRGFYDRILPAFVDKYTKKWGGKVEDSSTTIERQSSLGDYVIEHGDVADPNNDGRVRVRHKPTNQVWGPMDYDDAHDFIERDAKNRIVNRSETPVHSLEITPEMRKAVALGQPKFSPKVKPTVKDLTKEVPGLKKVVSNLTPDEIKDVSQRTAEKLVKLFSSLPSSEETAAVAYSGRAKRGWYQHSAQAIVDVFGQADGNRFAALLAALSPQTSVESNLENALRMWVNWNKAGRPTDPKKIGQLMGQSVQGTGGEASVLDAWRGNTIRALTDADPGRPDFNLSGPKVNSFAKNLRNEVNEVTNDAWMATYAAIEPEMLASRRLGNKVDNVGKSFGFKSPGYVAMSAMVRDAAKILTRRTGQRWTPAEVQETVWSWAKTLYERRDRAGEYRTAQQILKAADMTHEDVTSTPDFAVLLTRGIYRKILEGGNYADAIEALEKSRGGDGTAGRPSGPALSVTSAEGSGFAQSAFERHLQRAAARLERIRTDRRLADGVDPRALIADARDSEIAANMSAATNTIPGIAQLAAAANAGDESAARLVNLIAHESLERLIATVPDAKLEVSRNGGLYGGALEPSLGVKITFPEKRRGGVLAALAKFASNFNQEQIHVRQPTIDPVGRVYTDGSYATPVYSFELEYPLGRQEIEQVIAESGLYGLNFSDKKLEAYYVGDPRDAESRAAFSAAIERARGVLGGRARRVELSTARLWAYGIGEGATAGYDAINGDVPRGTSEYTEVPRAIAERDLGHEIDPSQQADEITEAQRLLQSKIADHYEQLPDNDMSNSDVRRAYEELSKVIQKQFSELPVKVDVWDKPGEPYKSSAEMRRDVLDNNHMWIFGTSADTFGPPGSDFRGHPLLELTGRESNNGYPLVVNDELRAVHDYYAHMLSPVGFGPKGEEAAWKNHLATIDNPWARWALTSETRGQNSWVNFGAHVDPNSKLADRPFARQKAALLPVEHMLTGNDAIDYITDEFIRTLPDYMRNGSLPRMANDPFAEFSPRVPSALREKLIRKDPSYKAMFADIAPKKQVAIGPLPTAEKPAPAPVAPAAEEEKPPRRKSLQPIEGTGYERERAINGVLYNVGEEAPQLERAARLVAEDPARALAIAMREVNPPAGVHPEFVYMALEEHAILSQDVELQEKLSHSRIAEEATTMGQRIAAWRNRAEISPVDDMRRVREAREARAKARGVDPEAQIDKVVDQARNFIRNGAKSTKKPNWNDFVASIICRT